MNGLLIILAIAGAWLVLLAVCSVGLQLLRQNGRILLRLEDLEQRVMQTEFGEAEEGSGKPASAAAAESSMLAR